MFGDGLYHQVLDIIDDWEPEEDYSNENQYRDNLASFLREELKHLNRLVSVKKEDGRGLCDLAIDEKIGIELKKDLRKKSQIDSLAGQIIRYKKAYQNIIVVLVGEGYLDSKEDLKDMIEDLKHDTGIGFNDSPSIEVIDKTWDDKEEEDEEEDYEKKIVYSTFSDYTFLK